MTIYMPDPHPGRCLNYRVVGDKSLRCLEYEQQEHVCRFPKPRPRPADAIANQGYMPLEPRTWVRPECGEV